MLKPGTIFCPYCCRTHTVPFYTGTTANGVELHYKGGKYDIVEKLPPDTNNPTLGLRAPDTVIGFQLDSFEETRYAGLPSWINVRIPGNAEPVRMRRTCPHCARQNDRANLGALPTLIVAMVGLRSSGKSALLNSMSYPNHVAAVNDEGYPYHISLSPIPQESGLAAATPRMGRGMTKLLTVSHRSNSTPICHVLLLDVSGEIYGDVANRDSRKTSRTPDNTLWDEVVNPNELSNILSGDSGYPGVDAVIFADPIPGSKPVTKDALKFGAANIMNDIVFLNEKLESLPMAYVFTHLDHYTVKTFPTYQRPSGPSIPLVSDTLFRTGRYSPAQLIDRIYIGDTIARRMPGFVPAARPRQITKGFLIQSCSCGDIPGIGLVEHYTDSTNVMDPLLWVLNKLQVFPLKLN